MHLLTNERYLTYQIGFLFGLLGHAQGWNWGVPWGPGVISFFQNSTRFGVWVTYINELGNEIKCEVCQAFYLFRNEFHKFNNTRARIFDSIFYTLKSHFCRKNIIILLCPQRCYGRHNVFQKSINHWSDQLCFLCINICLTPRVVLKSGPERRGL